MNIRILMLLLAISLLLAFTPRGRVVGRILSAVLAALLIWFTANQSVTRQETGISPALTPPGTANVVTPSAPEVTLQLDGSGAPWRLTGTITNPGDLAIRSITLDITRLDCPSADAAEGDCVLVWRGQHTLRTAIGATKSARIDDNFYSHETVPRLKGVARDRITVSSVQ